MKNWNYRVIEFPAVGGEPAWREMREVYYNDSGVPCAYGSIAHVGWDIEEDPAVPYTILDRMRAALDKPILHVHDFVPDQEHRSNQAMSSYTVVLEKDPDSDDLFLPLPECLLTDQDWRISDRINIEVVSEGRAILTNLSKAERET
jgi:hypothetical protein